MKEIVKVKSARHFLLPYLLFNFFSNLNNSTGLNKRNPERNGVWISDLSKFSAPTVAFLAF